MGGHSEVKKMIPRSLLEKLKQTNEINFKYFMGSGNIMTLWSRFLKLFVKKKETYYSDHRGCHYF